MSKVKSTSKSSVSQKERKLIDVALGKASKAKQEKQVKEIEEIKKNGRIIHIPHD